MSSPAIPTPASPEEHEALSKFETENAADIAAESVAPAAAAVTPVDEELLTAIVPETATPEEKQERLSKLQKINQMKVADKVKLAVLGDKEDRMILVRDGSKVV